MARIRGVDWKVKTKSHEWLESKSLNVANRQIEVRGELLQVKIRPLCPTGSGPNWAVAEFVPPLPPIAERAALDAISVLAGSYALAG
jgi:hypothetical protein